MNLTNTGSVSLSAAPRSRLYRAAAPAIVALGFALAALALYAWSNGLLYFSSEIKQYGVDAMIATLLLGVATNPDLPEEMRARRLAVLGATAVFFSNAVCLVLPGVWLHWMLSREDAGTARDSGSSCFPPSLSFCLSRICPCGAARCCRASGTSPSASGPRIAWSSTAACAPPSSTMR